MDLPHDSTQQGDPDTNAAWDRLFGPHGSERDHPRPAPPRKVPWHESLFWSDLAPDVQEALARHIALVHPDEEPISYWAFLSLTHKRQMLYQEAARRAALIRLRQQP